MVDNFNLKYYTDLLEKEARLKGIEAPTKTNENELDACQSQLFSYGALIEIEISYNRKDEYFLLIREYLAERIDPGTFRVSFLDMQEEDDNAR